MRIGEVRSLEWTGLDLKSSTMKVNCSEKGSNPRIFKASAKLIAMLNALPRTSEKIFQVSESSLRVNYSQQRRRIAQKIQRKHWKALDHQAYKELKQKTLNHYMS
jgi:hypothetical protein